MKLSRLEIVGFKSFADRMVFNFDTGITGVIGPNGCGKSNVVDAIRWVMGEQSAKNLRGRGMEDVIFNGTEERGPTGMAEVILTLKNDGLVPPEYAQYEEISIRRRLFRDGESEYAINKQTARLKDITDLFLGTGAGTRAYSVIEQGRIGFVVNSKPHERRFLLDEVAGITKYNARKKNAERRMEATEQNLLRIKDIVTELQKQLNSLERQAQKAERYKKLKEQLFECELMQASKHYLEHITKQHYAKREKEQIENELETLQIGIDTARVLYDTHKLTLSECEITLNRTSERVIQCDSRLKMIDKDLDFLNRDQKRLTEQGHKATEEAKHLKEQLEHVKEEISILQEHEEVLEQESEHVKQQLKSQEQKKSDVSQKLKALQHHAEQMQKQSIQLLTKLTEERTQIQNNERRVQEFKSGFFKFDEEQKTLLEQKALHQQKRTHFEQELKLQTQTEESLINDIKILEHTLTEQRTQKKQEEAQLLTHKGLLSEKKSRWQSLINIENNFEGYLSGVKFMMTEYQSRSSNVCALLADVIHAKEKTHEIALEAFLGDKLQSILMDSSSNINNAILALRQSAKGRASFISTAHPHISNFSQNDPVLIQLFLQHTQGMLCSYVHIDPAYEQAIAPLFENVYICQSLTDIKPILEHLDAMSGRFSNLFSFVSLEGDTLEKSNLYAGGHNADMAQGILQKKREIKELEHLVHTLTEDIQEKTNLISQLNQNILQQEQTYQQKQTEKQEQSIRRARTEKDIQLEHNEITRYEQRLNSILIQRQELQQKCETLEKDLHTALFRMKQHESAHQDQEEALLQTQDQVIILEAEEKTMNESLMRFKIDDAQKQEKYKSLQRTKERLTHNEQDLKERLVRAQSSATSDTQASQDIEQRIKKTQEEHTQTTQQLATLKHEQNELQKKFNEFVHMLKIQEHDIQSHINQKELLHKQKNKFDLIITETQLKLDHLCDYINTYYQVNLLHAITDYHTRSDLLLHKTADDIQSLKNQIAKIGDVNLMAIEEFEQVKKRFDFLDTQKQDLEQALTQLRSAILKINKASRERLQEAFHATNAMFKKVFPRLFRGGEASLELIYEGTDDILEAGVDIIAQPPGKKLQSVQLLSGGEKALTALSLVFAIFLIKPSPFCVLDEVDAPLDEGNVGRFNELLREMSLISQFVVITHNKRTMECANRLYGVTMEESGVSKLVSVNLHRKNEPTQASSTPQDIKNTLFS